MFFSELMFIRSLVLYDYDKSIYVCRNFSGVTNGALISEWNMKLTRYKDAAKNNISVRLLRYFGSSIIVTFIAGMGKPRGLRSKFTRFTPVHGHFFVKVMIFRIIRWFIRCFQTPYGSCLSIFNRAAETVENDDY